MDDLIVIDIESSGLDNGWPIEIAAVPLRDIKAARVWLIKPHKNWLKDRHWDEMAEEIHALTLDFLESDGLSAEQVAREVGQLLRDTTVVISSPFDVEWLNTLLDLMVTPPGGWGIKHETLDKVLAKFGATQEDEDLFQRSKEMASVFVGPPTLRLGVSSYDHTALFDALVDAYAVLLSEATGFS